MNQSEKNAKQRVSRRLNNNLHTKKYEKTRRGFLMRAYRNMQSRITGVQKAKHHLYKDKYILERETFYNWSMHDDSFNVIFDAWEKLGYPRKLTPSVDRIKSSEGYDLNNMEWITHSENSRRGSISRHSKKEINENLCNP